MELTPKEWAEQELLKIGKEQHEKNNEELKKDFQNFLMWGKSKIHIDEEGTIKAVDPFEEKE